MQMIYSNIVSTRVTREVQKETLNILADAISKSFGPNGSTTAITKWTGVHMQDSEGINVTHTKDGHTIIKNIQFLNPIERSVQELLTEMTRYVVKEVGDGTSSAIILCSTLFNAFCKDSDYNNSNCPSDMINHFHELIEEIKKRIFALKKECTLDDIYNICLISTNGNEYISKTLYQIYKQYGIDAYIDVGVSTSSNNIVKEYDGMTLETGFNDFCFINDKTKNQAILRNPKIYFFSDPIDTKEMLDLFDKILADNIMRAYEPNSMYEVKPTVILCKRITPDASSYLSHVVQLMNKYPGQVPLLIVPDIHQDYLFEDICQMCGAKFIKKYISPEVQKKDVEAGLAPTLETITNFCGTADEVRADQLKTQIIRPAKMFNEDGSYSDQYNMMVNYLKTQIDKNIAEGASVNDIAKAKRRYNSFKGNMIDFLIGGITQSDRDNLKASVEDAVLNSRSAAVEGVGYGANFMAFKVITDMMKDPEWGGDPLLHMLNDAYRGLITVLYERNFPGQTSDIMEKSLIEGCPLNIRTNEYDHKVLSSIKSDISILETIDKILAMMYMTNQYLVPTPANNQYIQWEEALDKFMENASKKSEDDLEKWKREHNWGMDIPGERRSKEKKRFITG